MESEIRFLRELGHDLERAAALEPARDRRRGVARAHPRKWLPAVAAVLVVSWAVGFVAQDPSRLSAFGGSDEATADSGGGGGGSAGEAEAPAAPAISGDAREAEYVLGWDALDERAIDAQGKGTGEEAQSDGASAATGDLSKIVRTGRMRVEVADGTFRDARDETVAIAESAGGFVLDSRVQGRSGSFTLRVPAARFDAVMTRLGRLGDVQLEEQNGEDVTAEYVDLQARTEILTARRDVIQRLMEQATTLNQTLMIQNRFDEVQLQLERITGQLRFLDAQVDESTIRLDLVERTAPQQRVEQVDNPSLLEAWKRGIQGFLNVLAVAIIGLGYLLPLLVAVGVWFAAREVMRRRRRA